MIPTAMMMMMLMRQTPASSASGQASAGLPPLLYWHRLLPRQQLHPLAPRRELHRLAQQLSANLLRRLPLLHGERTLPQTRRVHQQLVAGQLEWQSMVVLALPVVLRVTVAMRLLPPRQLKMKITLQYGAVSIRHLHSSLSIQEP